MEKKSQLSDILARTLQNLNLRSLIAKDYHQDISHPCYLSLCNNCHTLLYLTHFVIKSVTFCIPDALCNNNLSPFLVPDSLCNNNLSHFVIKLLCCFLRHKICQESLRNWLVTFWNEIYLSTFLPSYLHRLYLYFHKTYDHHTWQPEDLRWRTTSNRVMWPFDYIFRWSRDKWKKLYFHFHGVYDY